VKASANDADVGVGGSAVGVGGTIEVGVVKEGVDEEIPGFNVPANVRKSVFAEIIACGPEFTIARG